MRYFFVLYLFCSWNLSYGQDIFPTTDLSSSINESHFLLINEYGVYSFDAANDKTVIYHSYLSDTVRNRRSVDTLGFLLTIGDVSYSNDKLSGLFSKRRSSPPDSVVLQIDSLFYFHLSDTFDLDVQQIEIEIVDSLLGIQWFFSAFSKEFCMVIPFNASLNLSTINLTDSVQLINLVDGGVNIVPTPSGLSFGPLLLVDSFYYSFDNDDYSKVNVSTGRVINSVSVFRNNEGAVGGTPSFFYSNDYFYGAVNVSSFVIQRNNAGLIGVRIEKIDLDLNEINTVLLYSEEGIYNDRLTDISAGSFDNIYASEDGTVFHAGYAVTDRKLLATVLNPDFSIQTSFSFELDRALYLNQVYTDERDSILYVTAYEYLDGFRSDVDTIPLVYAIDYSAGGVSSGTLLPEPQHHSISVSPNPASSQVSIECKSCLSASERIQTVLIFSSEGRIVQRETVWNDSLDVSALQAGVYQVVFLNDAGSVLGNTKLLKR